MLPDKDLFPSYSILILIICALFHILSHYKRWLGFSACCDAPATAGQCWDQNPISRGRKGWAEMHQLLFCCKLSTVCMYPRSVHSHRTAQRGKPEAQQRIRPMEPSQEVIYFDQTWNIRKMSLTTGLRTLTADFCSHQYPFILHPKRTPHCFL